MNGTPLPENARKGRPAAFFADWGAALAVALLVLVLWLLGRPREKPPAPSSPLPPPAQRLTPEQEELLERVEAPENAPVLELLKDRLRNEIVAELESESRDDTDDWRERPARPERL